MSFAQLHRSVAGPPSSHAAEDVLELRYRSVSSFLVAYSTQLARGELFVETPEPLPINARALLRLRVAGASVFELAGQVAWIRRLAIGPGQPAGMGIALASSIEEHGGVIDALAARHERIRMAVTTSQPALRSVISRYLRSIVACDIDGTEAEPTSGNNVAGRAIDLAIVDLDSEGDAGALAVHALKDRAETAAVPIIAMARSERDRARAVALDVDEVLASPPLFNELRDTVVNALSRPSLVRPDDKSMG